MADFFSALGSIGSGLLDNLFANRRQEDQQAFNAQQFATCYQTTVKDMQAAGLNPMLAYSQGGGAGASSGIGSSSGSMTQAYSAYQENQRQRELLDAQKSQLDSQAALNSANAAKVAQEARSARIDADNKERFGEETGGLNVELLRGQVGSTQAEIQRILSQTGLNTAQIDVAVKTAERIGEEIKNIPKEGERLLAAAKQLMASDGLLRQQSISEVDRRKVLAAQAIQITKTAKLQQLDIDAAEKFNNLGRESGQARPFVEILKSVIGFFRR